MQNNFDDFRGNKRRSNSQGPGNHGKDRDNNKFQNFGKGLSGTFYYEDLTGEAKTRPSTPKKGKSTIKRGRGKSVNVRSKNAKAGRTFEKPSALVNKTGLKNNRNKGIFSSILDMFHGVGSKEKNMTISSRKTVEEIKKELDQIYDRIKEYESKFGSKSKEVSSKLVDLSKKVSKLNKEVTKSQRRIDMFEKQMKGYKNDLDKIKDTDDLLKQTTIDGKIKELNFKIKDLNFKIQEEQKKLESYKSELKPLTEKREALEKKSKEIKKSIANLKKKSTAIDQKLGRHSVSKESTFEILRRSIRRSEIEPSQVSAGDLSFRATFNSKTYNMEYQKTRGGIPGFSGLKFQKGPRFNWIKQRLKKAEQNGFSTTPSDERENNKEHGGKDNPDR